MTLLRSVSIVGIGILPVRKTADTDLRQMAASAVQAAMDNAGIQQVDALYASNMLSDELQGQKHLGALIADEAGLRSIEALHIRAATASGAAALRVAYLAVASGAVDRAVAVGVEKMSQGPVTQALSKALDAEVDLAQGATMISRNAEIMQRYLDHYQLPEDALADFAVNAHDNAQTTDHAIFRARSVSREDVMTSRMVHAPIRLYDCSPICDGAAAVVLVPTASATKQHDMPIQILGSSVVTDRFRLQDRQDPLQLQAADLSVKQAMRQAQVTLTDIDLFELHDAFSIIACLSLEAAGFAPPGEGWRLAREGAIRRSGRIPIATMGGLKARGHPIGATALYQAAEIALQLRAQAGNNQIDGARVGMMQSVGGVASTVITHILGISW